MTAAAEANYPLAIQEFQTAASLDPELDPSLYYNLGLAYAQLHRYDEAIIAYLHQRANDVDDYDNELALARAYQAKGMRLQADEAMRLAAQLKK